MIPVFLSAAVNILVHVPMDAAGFARARPRYVRMLRTLGAVHEHPGRGWWFATPQHLVAEPVDHLEVRADARRALRVLAVLLPRMRRELHQSATLAELEAGWYLPAASTRTVRVSVISGSLHVQHAAEYALSLAGGGASAEPAAASAGAPLWIWSSVPPDRVAGLRIALQRLGLSVTTERSTFDMYP